MEFDEAVAAVGGSYDNPLKTWRHDDLDNDGDDGDWEEDDRDSGGSDDDYEH